LFSDNTINEESYIDIIVALERSIGSEVLSTRQGIVEIVFREVLSYMRIVKIYAILKKKLKKICNYDKRRIYLYDKRRNCIFYGQEHEYAHSGRVRDTKYSLGEGTANCERDP